MSALAIPLETHPEESKQPLPTTQAENDAQYQEQLKQQEPTIWVFDPAICG